MKRKYKVLTGNGWTSVTIISQYNYRDSTLEVFSVEELEEFIKELNEKLEVAKRYPR